MDYNTLTAQIKKYAYRTDADFNDQVKNIIEQAMSRIYSEAKGGGFLQVIEGALSSNSNRSLIRPQFFRQAVSLQITIPANRRPDNQPFKVYLEPRSFEYCDAYAPNPTARGTPVFYSDDTPMFANNLDSYIYIVPYPDFQYPYKLIYLTFPPVFNAQNSTNFVTDKYPNLLLNACMVEAMIYLKYDERVPVFETKYKAALDAINNDTRGRYVDRTGKRDKT